MQRSSNKIGALAAALAKAQTALKNPPKSLTATIESPFPREGLRIPGNRDHSFQSIVITVSSNRTTKNVRTKCSTTRHQPSATKLHYATSTPSCARLNMTITTYAGFVVMERSNSTASSSTSTRRWQASPLVWPRARQAGL